MKDAGIVILAENNGVYDYRRLATYAGARASSLLRLPFVILESSSSRAFIKEYDDGLRGSHLVSGVAKALRDSPFRYTLLMDADFVIASDLLLLEMERFIASGDPFRFARTHHAVHVNVPPANKTGLWMTLFLYDQEHPTTRELLSEAIRATSGWYMMCLSKALSSDTFDRNVVFRHAEDCVTKVQYSLSPEYRFTYMRASCRQLVASTDTHVTHKTSLLQWYAHGDNKGLAPS